jgi:hypothetical protein
MKKTTFSKILFLGVIIFGVFALSSCKKNSDNPSTSGYYVKFKLDGADKQYTETTAAVFTTMLPLYSCAMVGEQLISGTVYEGMGITIFNDAAIAANVTYTDALVASIGTPQASLLYTDATGAQSSSAFATSPNVSVVITSMDDKTVTGTFSGTIVSSTDLTTSHTVTEGTFHLPRN